MENSLLSVQELFIHNILCRFGKVADACGGIAVLPFDIHIGGAEALEGVKQMYRSVGECRVYLNGEVSSENAKLGNVARHGEGIYLLGNKAHLRASCVEGFKQSRA